MTSYTPTTEIRQVQFELDGLVGVLEDDWRTLFYLIPKRIADIERPDGAYPLKYNGTQESELDEYGRAENIRRARLLLDEWGTSGQKGERPTLGHLYTLVVKGGMYRAADHIAKLLKIPKPERPQRGPAAPIDLHLEMNRIVQEQLDEVSYPNTSALQNGDVSINVVNNLDYQLPTKREDIVNPPLAVPDSIIEGSLPVFSRSDNNDVCHGVMPMLSDLLRPGEHEVQAGPSGVNDIPMLSILGNTLSSTSDSSSDSSSSSSIISEHISRMLPAILPTIHETGELPNLSIFGGAEHSEEVAVGMPAISALLNHSSVSSSAVIGQSEVLTTSESSASYSTEQMESRSMSNVPSANMMLFSSTPIVPVPPLMNFPYRSLQSATADFDKRQFTNRNPSQPDGRILGTGGFGEVFLALNLTSDTPLAAVKCLFPSNYKYREKFDREREILSKHNHPNIVKLLGFSEDSTLCLVYEYLPDGTLGGALERSRRSQLQLPVSKRLSYLLGIAAAIEYLHSPLVQVVHRDVTLANILLHGATAKLCDFGLVKRVNSMTATEVMGTGPYISPEAMRGTVTPALDVYSYGVVLAEVVTGEEVLSEMIPDGEGDLIERVTARGADLEALVDRRVSEGELRSWLISGRKLLELSNWCLRERFKRPTASAVRETVLKVMREGTQ
ncbi:protein Tube-like [Ochlerotatus camptorhynchus]|uniref:protein Tube-like n=1 Tax=Ochlerotatus camptorhynchus TaxID=644619 RepID=UPI0031D2C70D